ncbi:hypothetical protein ABNF97_03085 [Plantactinospora sp. B6F1]|uniref:hypothetical protein n=1 Tax=Plantactinospora sp. B6F1 TaxID=3158971 RepID=UPI0032D8E547
MLIIGGRDEACPVSAHCVFARTPLTDGAALDPLSGHWRRLADSPTPLSGAQGVIIGSVAYILAGATALAVPAELLVYDIDRDSWERLPAPFDGDAGYRILAAGDRLVAYPGSHEIRSGKDYVLDPQTRTWAPLPTDPLGAGYDRTMAWTGREVVLFDHELVSNPGADKPPVTRAATLDLTNRSWERLTDSTILTTAPWIAANGELVNPTLGHADGGQIGNWGRPYPNGGRIDPTTGTWSVLPAPPTTGTPGAGAYTNAAAVYVDVAGPVLDTTTGTWQQVPAVPDGDVTDRTVVAAGVDMLVFGGVVQHNSRTAATLVGRAWIWSPPFQRWLPSSAPEQAEPPAVRPAELWRSNSDNRARTRWGCQRGPIALYAAGAVR